jgi:cell wall assembly regulator SMI1
MNIQLFFDALKKVMPNVMDKLNPPVTDEQIAALKASYNFEIDPLYIDFLKVCNGEKDLVMMGLGMWMTDLERGAFYHSTEWMNWYSIADNPHLCKDQYYSKKRVQIMGDGGGSYWFLDYDPAHEGKMGQVVCVFRDQAEIVYNCFESFEELLQTVIDTIESGAVKLSDMQSFDFGQIGNGINFYANKSALYKKNNLKIPDNFFTALSPEWLFTISNASHNPIINRDGNWAKPIEALAVKEIQINDPKMMESFCEIMQYLPNVQFIRIWKEIDLEEKHFAIIRKLRLHTLNLACYVDNIATLTNNPESLRKLTLVNFNESKIDEMAIFKNIHFLDIQRKNDDASLAFLQHLKHIEELQLWHPSTTTIKKENVQYIEQIPALNNFSTRYTTKDNFENIIARPSPFYNSFTDKLDWVR